MRRLVSFLMGMACCIGCFAQTQQAPTLAADITRLKPSCYLNFNEASGAFRDVAAGVNYVKTGAGTVLYHQPGYDSTNPSKFSAGIPYNASISAPSNALCDLDWNQTWSIVVVIDNLNFNRSDYHEQILLTKGVFPDAGNTALRYNDAGAIGWSLVLNWTGSTTVCFMVGTGGNGGGSSQVCSSADLKNGHKYILTITNDGTGSGSALSMIVNGSVINTAGIPNTSMSTATTCPLQVSDDCTHKLQTQGNNVTVTNPINVDTVAIFPRVLPIADIESLWINTKWYQDTLGPVPATPKYVIFDNDGCADPDNGWALAMLVRLHQLGYVKLIAVNSTTTNTSDSALYRNLLSQSGLAHVPVSTPSTDGLSYVSLCTNIGTYSPNVPALNTYPGDTATLQAALNSVPSGQKAAYVIGGSYASLMHLLQANSALVASKVSAVYAQGGGDDTTTNTRGAYGNETLCITCGAYVFANLPVPLYLKAASTHNTGPFTELTRSVPDSLSLFIQGAIAYGSPNYSFGGVGSLLRSDWDSLPVISVVAPSLMGVASQGAYSITGSNQTWTVSGTGTMFNQSFTESNANMYSWLNNSLDGTRAQPAVRRSF